MPNSRSPLPFSRVLALLTWRAWLACTCASAACGPDQLPAFANPPPVPDASFDAEDAGSDSADAGKR